MAVLLQLLTCCLHFWSAHSPASQAAPDTPRRITNVPRAPRASDVEFAGFQFQQPTPMHVGVSLYRIDGEPSIGARYVVSASIGGQEAIATATFEAVDEAGLPIQAVAIAPRGTSVPGDFEFIGIMTVPKEPFRIALNGQSVDGSHFKRVLPRLFRPVDQAPSIPGLGDLPRDIADHFRRLLDRDGGRLVAEVEAFVLERATVPLVMSRTDVSNVMFAPLKSAAGRPIGFRITYDVQFSEHGLYNPKLRVHPEYNDSSSRSYEMRVLNSSVEPLPRDAHAPEKPAGSGHDESVLAFGASFLYEPRTVYHFSVDLVPGFLQTLGRPAIPCILQSRFRTARDPEKAFAQMLASDTATYRVYIGGTAFEGRIEGMPGEGAIYRSFVAEGASECR